MIRLLETRRVLMAVLALGLFAMSARNATDPDLWWHLRTGQLTLQNHAIFHTDPFSFTRFGQPWINHEWLSDVLMFLLLRMAGWTGIIAGFALGIAVTFFLVFMRCPRRPYIASLFTVWAALAAAPLCAARPQMFSLFLFSLFLFLLERADQRPVVLWFLPPLMLIWVNLHAGYIAGIAILALSLLGEALAVPLGWAQTSESRPRLKRLTWVLALCLALIPLNPYGMKIFAYPFMTLRSEAMQTHIAEWFSPDFHQPQYLPVLFMVLAAVGLLAISPRRMRPREILLVLATLFAGLTSVRNLVLFVLVVTPVLSGSTEALLEKLDLQIRLRSSHRGSRSLTPAKIVVNLVLLLTVGIFAAGWVRIVIGRQPAAEASIFPTAAVSFLSSHQLPPPVFNHYDWGGYLIWREYPAYRVYVDGRADVYGESIMHRFADSYSLYADWEAPLRAWQIRTVILPPAAPLLNGLGFSPRWKRVYGDSQAVILVRDPWQ